MTDRPRPTHDESPPTHDENQNRDEVDQVAPRDERRASWLHPLLRRRQMREDGPPSEPFYKDARILHGRLRVDVSVRALLIALIVFVLIVASTIYYLVDQNQKLTGAVKANHTLSLSIKQTQKDGRAARLKAEAEANEAIASAKREVQSLACFLWNFIQQSPDVGLQGVARQIDEAYHCTLLQTEPSKPGGGSRPTPSRPARAPSGRPTPESPRSSSRPTSGSRTDAGGRPSAASSAPRTTRSPGTTSAPAPTPTPPTPRNTAIIDLGPILCKVRLTNC